MKTAIIDIGSNSIKMRIYEDLDFYHPSYYMNVTRLAKGLMESGKLCKQSIDDSFDTIVEFKKIADDNKVDNIYIFATQALREASNRDVLLNKVNDTIGIDIDVIDGQTEAEIGYLGASSEIRGDITLIDIGGASTEIVMGKERIEYAKSYPVGAVKLREEQVDLNNIFNTFEVSGTFVGIGGTITTIAAIKNEIDDYKRSAIQAITITLDEIEAIQNRLLAMSIDERKSVIGLHPSRADIICYGIEILLHVMRINNIGRVMVSDFGSMEGYIKYKGLL